MLCHWRYVLDNLFGEVKAVSCLGATHIPERVDEAGKPYAADADDAAYATFELEGGVIAQINSSWTVRVRRDDLVTFQVDGTHGSAVAGLTKCWTPAPGQHAEAGLEPRPAADDRLLRRLGRGARQRVYDNGFKVQWEMFLRHVAEDAPWGYGLLEGAKGVQLAELGLQSWTERRWLDVPGAGGLTAMATLDLPAPDRRHRALRATGAGAAGPSGPRRVQPRSPMRAAHVVADPLADNDPWLTPAIDWEAHARASATISGTSGFGVAEAMDTAQRGMGLGWPEAQELIRRALAAAKGRPAALIACGAGTDHLAAGAGRDGRRRDRAPTRSRSRRSRRWAGGSS